MQFPSFVTYEKKFNSSKKNFSLRDELKNHYDGVFDEFEIKLVEASGGAFEVYVNDSFKVFSKLNVGRFPNSTFEITKTIDDSIHEGRLR